MSELTLLNLSSQSEAVAKYVEGWKISDILDWMREYGTVVEPREDDLRGLYLFISETGFKDVFYFSEAQHLVVMNSGWLP